ncbi:NADPH:quinone reductase-like Zn-dependent oxidoreductase [Asanoa ferruginea]|uniref:enoyl-[acyl-carrier-protein] reductase n=1 Tax=Asanoa ferruginea TaxID=53367 RepID=A0A3D9ZFV2_9ACTN|nr:zinc-dependent alcohol dehydrogenase family protein [Asanoa ferruginea]REF96155.1 NADPH:quinone reductase-like Zn-dependent oxidoreductase [Asanoa ferruginea]GIF49298.1 trans-2-enoyl-CoA reductase [Asanoa ferruginea]
MSRLILTAVGGDPDQTVELDDDHDLTVGPDDVLVTIEAAPINPADQLFMLGWFGVYPQVPNPVGAEGVGRVTAAGPAVDQALVGRRVIILPTFVQGTWADQVVVPARNVVPVTDQADPKQLAMLPVNPATAYALLNDYVTIQPGDWIGLGLANSGVGQNVIALAKRAGIKVLAIVRRDDAAKQATALGADRVVIDGEHLGARIADALDGAKLRVLFDGGAPGLDALAPHIASGGTVVTFSSVTGAPPTVPLADLIYRGISLRAFYILNWVQTTPREKLERVYGELADLVAQGVLGTEVEATYPLTQYREALAHAGQQQRTGKILFVPGQEQRA